MEKIKLPEVGDKIYVPSSCSISHGSTDTVGGLGTINKVEVSKHLSEDHYNSIFISIEELPGHGYNYRYLLEKQNELKEKFGDKAAYPDPDIDTPWIEEGDWVNGKRYTGPPIW